LEHRIDWFDRMAKTVALSVALAGLIIAPYQLGKLTDSIDVSTKILGVAMFSNVANSTLDIDKVFVSYPELYKYFSSGADIAETEPDYPKARAIGLLMLDYFDHVRPLVVRASQLSDHPMDLDSWDRYFVSVFRASPLLCRLYRGNKEYYGAVMRSVAEPICSQNAGRAAK
jgi:hypothetical protein